MSERTPGPRPLGGAYGLRGQIGEEHFLRGLCEIYRGAADELERLGDPVLVPLLRELLGKLAAAEHELSRLEPLSDRSREAA